MKRLISCFVFFSLISCVKIVPTKNPTLINEAKPIDDKCRTEKIEDQTFTACLFDKEGYAYILKEKDTIYKVDETGIGSLEFIDFNQDGYKDIMFAYTSNYPAYELGLYNQKTKNFSFITNYPEYPNSTKIGNTNYYYSYSKAGCADANWISHLFYIENYTIIPIGFIHGIGCGNEKTGIYIYKINGDEKTQISFIPKKTGYDENKWAFIEKYWTENYTLFVK